MSAARDNGASLQLGHKNDRRFGGGLFLENLRKTISYLQQAGELLAAIGKDPIQGFFDIKLMEQTAQRAEGWLVVDAVLHERPVVVRLDLVEVIPETVGAEALLVDERASGVQMLDFSDPGVCSK